MFDARRNHARETRARATRALKAGDTILSRTAIARTHGKSVNARLDKTGPSLVFPTPHL
ncbi:hypothetical protein WCLP8_1780015 [uncultured Gammaproteobacteria bacterium]